ncbi:MAG: flagellar hook-length control protein FliK [Lachnospiraceae bacterium]|nr:flagellar hook-length control protein FliK [Lachnospiraceae bacterium]
MNLNLNNILLNNRPMQDTTVELNVNQLVNAEVLKRQIRALVPGQTILGEIVAKNGSDIQIRLLDNLLVNARLDQDMNIGVGKSMTFQVKNNGAALTLSPLYENMATEASALKALDMAGLPVTEKTMEMAGKLMEQGLPIDKNTLQQVYRELNLYPQAPVGNIVNLHKMGIPVNEVNLSQYNAYQNMNHQLLEGMGQMLNDFPQLLNTMAGEGKFQDVATLLKQLVGMAAGEPHVAEGSPQAQTINGEGIVSNLQEQAVRISDDRAGSNPSEVNPLGEIGTLRPGEIKWDLNGIAELLQRADESADTIKNLLEQLRIIQNKTEPGASTGEKLLSTLLEGIKEKWLLSPEEMEEPGRVQEFYRKLTHQLSELTENLEQLGQQHSSVYKATVNMNQNLEFLQQLNQLYTYVQLPIKLQHGEAHGDLYVYTNKRHLASKDGQISALLHLDMEHLGPVDVYVAMQNERLNTNFYLKDDEMLDFIHEHMELLTERLKKRGYHCNFELSVRNEAGQAQEKASVNIDSLLEREHKMPIAMYSFDVRG